MRTSILTALALAALAALAPAPASAEVSFDVNLGASVPVGDDAHLFFTLSSRYFDRDERVVESLYGQYRNSDDVAVSLFIASHSAEPPDAIFALRRQGLGWFEVARRVHVPYEVWFPAVERDPGPPYGRAYGYWNKHRTNPHSAVALSDAECRNLVAVRMASEYYRVPVESAMEWRASGRSVQDIMNREYRSRHGRTAEAREHGRDDDDRGHGHGHGKGHEKHDHDHDRD